MPMNFLLIDNRFSSGSLNYFNITVVKIMTTVLCRNQKN